MRTGREKLLSAGLISKWDEAKEDIDDHEAAADAVHNGTTMDCARCHIDAGMVWCKWMSDVWAAYVMKFNSYR